MNRLPRQLACACACALAICVAFAGRDAHAELILEGLDEAQENNARSLMALDSAACELPAWRVQRLYRDGSRQLGEALEALGYYRANIEGALTFDEGECWKATFTVQPGEPVRLRNVVFDVRGDAASALRQARLFAGRRPAAGDILHHGNYESYKRLLMTRLARAGYFDARFVAQRVTVDESLQYADIEVIIDSGLRYYFGDIEFNGNILRPELLVRYAEFKPGDPYDSAAITKLHESLSGSGYFESVSIRADPVADGGRVVPVSISLTPAKRHVYSMGAGYATDIGLQGRLGYTDRRRNDRGHQFDARLYASEVESEITGVYRWPRKNPTAEWVDIYGGYQHKETETSRSDKTTVGIRVSRMRTEKWLETPYISYTDERFRVAEQADASRLLIPGIKWETSRGRELRRMKSGRRLSLDLRGAHASVFSDTTFFQGLASAKWITSLGESTRLLARTSLGFTVKDELEELPATVRFFTGGDTSVRGYGFETIGPLDDQGEVTGGSNLAVFSVEFDRLVAGNWAVAAFVDSGSAFNNRDVDFKTGIGIGLRWYSPLGPIRIDVAHPLDDPDKDVRLHITLGTDL